MKTQNHLLNIILIISLSCFFQFVKAQIVYTDVNPDQNLSCSFIGCNQNFELDVNNDGISDFTVTVSHHICYPLRYESSVSASALMLNKIAASSIDYYPSQLLYNDSIISSLNWQAGGILSLKGDCLVLGKWTATPGYLGLQIVVDGKLYYGWVKLSLSVSVSSAAATIYDYAFNSIPNKPILAGQTCTPQSEIFPAGPITFCLGDSSILSSVNSGNTLSYQWKKDGANVTGATNKTYTAKSAGKYKVKVTDNTNGCTASSAVVKVKVPCKVLSEELNDNQPVLNIYPNPIQASATITLSLSVLQKVTLEVFDMEGRLIRTLANEQMSEGAHIVTWNATDENGNEVSDGIYFLKMQTESEVKTIVISVAK